MNRLTEFFLFLGSLYLVLFLLERGWALRPPARPLFARMVTNAAISAAAFGASALLVQPLVKYLLGEESQIGILGFLDLPWQWGFPAAFLLLDLSFYYWHRLSHKVPLLWRFHAVHHSDPDLDVTTAFRFHPGEIAISAVFRAAQLSFIGPSAAAFLLYETVFQAGTLFHHSNLRLPAKLEKVLCLLIVTPRMHGLHHSLLRKETNSNYSVVFSFWDRFHRSLTPVDLPQKEVGIPGYRAPGDNSIFTLLKQPFRKQRPYW